MTKKLFAQMRARRADTIRAKLAQLSLSDKDITEAIAWVRLRNRRNKGTARVFARQLFGAKLDKTRQ